MMLKFEFKVICITETWCSDNSLNHNLFKLPQYKSIHQVRRTCKGGGIAVFLYESLTFNVRHDLSVNNADIEALCVEIINKKSKNILINTQYRQPAGNFNEFEAYLNTFLAKSKTTDKICFLVGDLNLNLMDYQSNAKVRDFVNLIFQHSLVPIVNKPTRVTKNNATLIDYIITNSFMDQENLTGILKRDISDHFPSFTISVKHRLDSSDKKVEIRKGIINADSIQEFRHILSEVDWGNLYSISNPNDAYDYFLKVFSGIYDLAFPLKTLSVKRKTLQNPWMTKGLLKSSKRKQKLYEKFMKKRSPRNENIYKAYKSLFESLKKKSKKNYYTRCLENYQNDIKKSWDYWGAKSTKGIFPKRMIIDDQEISDQGKIANCFNKFFVDIGPKLASMIPESETKFDQYLNPHQTFMGEGNLTDDELKEALRSLKPNKSPGYDNISSNVVNETSDIFFIP